MGRAAGWFALERPEGANGRGRSDAGHAHQRVHRYRSSCLHNEKHGESQCTAPTGEPAVRSRVMYLTFGAPVGYFLA